MASLEELLRNKTAKIGVIGLGYVGLPLIRAFIAAGYRTLGYDVDQSKVDRLLKGESYIGLWRQITGCQCDHHGVVARQQNIGNND